jgi:two-component system, OmpR family, response regulator
LTVTGSDMLTILVVDDTEDIRDLIHVVLTRKGFNVLTADGGQEMDAILHSARVHLIVLDAMMPGEDGLSICRRISAKGGPPIIMLSARGEQLDRLKGLELGAQDYIAKPFLADELAARIRIVLGRQASTGSPLPATSQQHFFGWSLDTISRRITSPTGADLVLSQAEYAVMSVLLNNPDRPLKRDFILEAMSELHEDTTERALDTLISRLRRKLRTLNPNALESDELIRTVYATGYMLRPQNIDTKSNPISA